MLFLANISERLRQIGKILVQVAERPLQIGMLNDITIPNTKEDVQ